MNLDSDVLWAAAGLMLIFEGICPFLCPTGWRQRMSQLLALEDGQIRFFGLVCVFAGLLVLAWLA